MFLIQERGPSPKKDNGVQQLTVDHVHSPKGKTEEGTPLAWRGGRERRACVAVGVGRAGPAPPPPAQPSTRPPPRARASPREAPADARTERSSSSSAWASPAPTPLPPGVSRSRPRPALPFCGRDDGPKGTSDLPGVSNSCGVQARSSSCSLSISESPQPWPVPWWLDAHGRFCSGPTDHIQGKKQPFADVSRFQKTRVTVGGSSRFVTGSRSSVLFPSTNPGRSHAPCPGNANRLMAFGCFPNSR